MLSAILILLGLIVIGVSGYMIIEGDIFLDSLYMTIITISTVGFGEIHKLTTAGKVFTIILILSSFGTYAYAISVITTHLVEGQLSSFFAGAGLRKAKINKMDNHIIICGFGRNGKQSVHELLAHDLPFIVVESNHDVIMKNLKEDIRFIEGDATDDDILDKANITTARALITTLPNDADNTFVALTARALNPDLLIISRAESEMSEKKLKVAGANNVIMPERVGGAHMATLVANPDVVEFLDRLSVHGDEPTNLEEIMCENITDKDFDISIREFGIRSKTGANIIGMKTSNGDFILNPSSEIRVDRGSKLFVLGTQAQIKLLKEIIAGQLPY